MMKEYSDIWLGPDHDGKIDGLFLDDRLPEPSSAIRVARLYDIPDILPAAYYDLFCIHSLQDDWDVLRKPNAENALHLKNRGRTARWQLLDALDLIRLIRMQQVLDDLQKLTDEALDDVSAKCTISRCAETRESIRDYLFGSSDSNWRIGENVLDHISSMRGQIHHGMCRACGPMYDITMIQALNKIWESILTGE